MMKTSLTLVKLWRTALDVSTVNLINGEDTSYDGLSEQLEGFFLCSSELVFVDEGRRILVERTRVVDSDASWPDQPFQDGQLVGQTLVTFEQHFDYFLEFLNEEHKRQKLLAK